METGILPMPFAQSAPAVDGLGGGLGALLLASLLFRGNGLGGFGAGAPLAAAESAAVLPLASDAIASRTVELQNTSNLRTDVKDSEAGIRESILNQNIGNAAEFRSIHDRIASTEKETVRAQYEGKIASLESQNQLATKVDHTHNTLNRQLFESQVANDKSFYTTQAATDKSFYTAQVNSDRQFAAMQQHISDKFNEMQNRDNERQIAFLKEQLTVVRNQSQSDSIVAGIVAAIKQILPSTPTA